MMRHLWAAVQLMQKWRNQPLVPHSGFSAILDKITSLDFLAQSIVPCSQSTLTLAQVCESGLHDSPELLATAPPSIYRERAALLQIISKHNCLDKVIWGPWYSTSSRPKPESLLHFQQELLQWKSNSPLTFQSCFDQLDGMTTAVSETPVELLPIPPKPLLFSSADAALNVALFNNYMACASSMLNIPGSRSSDGCTFEYVYQNLRIAEGLCAGKMGDDYTWSEKPEINISLLLYLGFRRCYSHDWQMWTIEKLRQCGRQGLLDGHAFANALENLWLLQRRAELRRLAIPSYSFPRAAYGEVGPLHSRIIPLLLPKVGEDQLVAYYFEHDLHDEERNLVTLRPVARACWRQDDSGSVRGVKFDYYDRSPELIASPKLKDEIFSGRHLDGLRLTTQSSWNCWVETGWHSLLDELVPSV